MSNTRTLPLVALADEIILPDTTKTLEIIGRFSRKTLRYAFKEGTQVFVCKFAKDKDKFESVNDVCNYGVLCNVVDLQDKIDKTVVRLSG
ncbi:MAG: LON peptidase substrate-binding domain-containing protein, partial [Clostridia bacterium]|nr:LON peptidase substrate-binding domain-containing protein [Clostridia bacterium]